MCVQKVGGGNNRTEQLDDLLAEIGDVTSGNLGSLCISQQFRSVPVSVRVDAFEAARQKADMLARLLQDLGQLDNQGLYFIDANLPSFPSLMIFLESYEMMAGRDEIDLIAIFINLL